MSIQDAKKFYAHRRIRNGDKICCVVDVWLRDPRIRRFDGVTFRPSAEQCGSFFNLWTGFEVKPASGNSCEIFLEHLRLNVCSGDDDLFRWLLSWFSDIFRSPEIKPGTAVALRGPKGVGKSIVGDVIRRLIGRRHSMVIEDSNRLVGGFNSHLADKLFVQLEEAVMAYDKKAEAALKHLVTGADLAIEAKHADIVNMPNFMRVLITSNEDWVVRATSDERRWAVFDVDQHNQCDHGFFRRMFAQLEDGGYSELMRFLLTWDASGINLRQPPRTSALIDQILESMGPEEQFWYECLMSGRIQHDAKTFRFGEKCDKRELYSCYEQFCLKHYVRDPSSPIGFGRCFSKMCPSCKSDRMSKGERRWRYQLPELERCRQEFSEYLGTEIQWED